MRKRFSILSLLAVCALLTSPIWAGPRHAPPGPAESRPPASLTITLLDPVPMLLKGAAVTTNFNALATRGRVVSGVGADGVTEMVVRFPATAGARYRVTLLNDQGVQSTSASDDGALGGIGSTSFTQSRIIVKGVNTSAGAMGFAIYLAPADFPRAAGTDASSASRTVSIQVQPTTGGATTQPVTILRPPVVLIHGLWADTTSWDTFTPFITDTRFITFRANYGQVIGNKLTAYTPSYPNYVDLSTTPASAMGFSYNAPTVLNQISNFVSGYKTGQNPLGLMVAAVQSDIVCHSMGGDVTRWLTQLSSFLSNNTFAQGSVHKVVTIATPHLGSPLATDILDGNVNQCVRNTLATYGAASFATATVGTVMTTGGTEDLMGDGFGGGLSQALQTIGNPSTHPFPFAMIQGLASQSQFDALNTSTNAFLIRLLCSGDPLANDLTGSGWVNVFNQSSDAIVPALSSINNLAGTPVNGVIHDSSSETIGFGPPAELEAAGGISDVVVNLLNTNVASTTYYRF